MNLKTSNKYAFAFFILFFVICIDQTTKRIAEQKLVYAEIHSFFWDIFRIQYVKNTGAFLSFGSSYSPTTKLILFIFFPALLLITMLFFMLRSKHMGNFSLTCVSLIIGGGLGNLIDRVVFDGNVTDFFNLGIGSLRTGIWNIADMAIMFGAIGLIIISFLNPRSKSTLFKS